MEALLDSDYRMCRFTEDTSDLCTWQRLQV